MMHTVDAVCDRLVPVNVTRPGAKSGNRCKADFKSPLLI